MRQRGRRGVVPRETPLESGLHGLDAVGHSLLVVGGSSLPATEVLGSASAIMVMRRVLGHASHGATGELARPP